MSEVPIEPVSGRLTGETSEYAGGLTFGTELSVAIVPLLEQARELVDRKVTVYIAGGIQVDGRLVDVDDEALVATVDDDDTRYHVAIESIAVLAVKR
ncbi:hypothetical protein [Blastococcus sp. CT_GayMR16]|uniref:DUF6897 domain-containing protein n=1 Tax=Blastococcus sp. CT_GayMR16 TaxID=2559607 RepID=UPI001074625F|nr:hypothetical protein [Blastococcus sp. CT_GayMR16]TFV90425.1 hypothetical protein E4P38_03015 [Blastococcus sp. CT_GayMR16]